MLSRYLKFALKIWRSNRRSLTEPFKLTYVTTKECHSRCINCSIWKVKPSGELTLDEITQLAKNSPFLSWIDFTGGEPTDRPDLVQVIKAFIDHCPDLLFVHFPTNGLKTRRIEKVVQELLAIKAPNLTLTVSIDGPPELNDRLRGIPGDFEKAAETFKAVRALGVPVYIGMTLYEESRKKVPETVAALQQRIPGFTYRDLHVNIPHISGHYYENTSAAPVASVEMAAVIDDLMAKRGFPRSAVELIERMYHKKVRPYLASAKTPVDCAALMSSCFLSENGMVYPCNIWNEPLGNIRDSGYSLLPILAQERSKALREQLLRKECTNCWTPCEAYQSLLGSVLRRSAEPAENKPVEEPCRAG